MKDSTQFFIISLGTIGVGLVALIIRTIYKSKCTKIECCCLRIERNVRAENTHDNNTRSERTDDMSI
jgi:hypothetical protein